MITLSPIVGTRRKDGTHSVSIRVTFHRVKRYIPTTIYLSDSDLSRAGKVKNGNAQAKIDDLLQRLRTAASAISVLDLERATPEWVVQQLKRKAAQGDFRLNFFDFADEFLKGKTPQTAGNYRSAVNAFESFIGSRDLDINEITKSLLLEFRAYLDASPRKGWKDIAPSESSRTSRYCAMLAAIFKAAKLKYNDEDFGDIVIPRDPFASISTLSVPAGKAQKSLGADIIQKIIDSPPSRKSERIAVSAFLLSFLTMGANLADLFNAKKFPGEWWVYNRTKTKGRRADRAEMRVKLPPEAAKYIKTLQDVPHSRWWLPAIHKDCTYSALHNRITSGLRSFIRRNGLPDFTFYAARHTWATLARKAGVEKATVDECLCHVGDFALTDIYAERDWDNINAANRKVLELFDWKP